MIGKSRIMKTMKTRKEVYTMWTQKRKERKKGLVQGEADRNLPFPKEARRHPSSHLVFFFLSSYLILYYHYSYYSFFSHVTPILSLFSLLVKEIGTTFVTKR